MAEALPDASSYSAACICLEWAGSGQPIRWKKPATCHQYFLQDESTDISWQQHVKRVRDFQKRVVLDMCDDVSEVGSIYCRPELMCTLKARVYAGHCGPELTLAPDVTKQQEITSQKAADHVLVWKHASRSLAACVAKKQHPQSPENCFVLTLSLYDDVACACAKATSRPGDYTLLKESLRHDERVVMSLVTAKPESILEVVKECGSSVFRRNKSLLLAAGKCYYALQYACADLRKDKDFVEQMMQKNSRAIQFAHKSLLTPEFVGQAFEDMHDTDIETMWHILSCSTDALKDNKPFMLKVVARWPLLFWHVFSSSLESDSDIVSATISAAKSKQWWRCSDQDTLEMQLDWLVCRAQRFHDRLYDSFRDRLNGYCRSDRHENVVMHEYKDVTEVEEYYPDVHMHEIVLCTSQERCCNYCNKQFNSHAHYAYEHNADEHYRCAVWCGWDACVACVEDAQKNK